MGHALGEFEQPTLLALIQLGGEAWGTAVGEATKEKTRQNASASGIHTTRDRLAKRGKVSSTVGDST